MLPKSFFSDLPQLDEIVVLERLSPKNFQNLFNPYRRRQKLYHIGFFINDFKKFDKIINNLNNSGLIIKTDLDSIPIELFQKIPNAEYLRFIGENIRFDLFDIDVFRHLKLRSLQINTKYPINTQPINTFKEDMMRAFPEISVMIDIIS